MSISDDEVEAAYQAAWKMLKGTSADIGVGELDRIIRAALRAAAKVRAIREDDGEVADEEINRLEETLGALQGKHGEGWINISMEERRLFARLLRTHIAALASTPAATGEKE